MRRIAAIAAFALTPLMATCSSGLPNLEIPYLHGIGWLSDLKGLSVRQIQERVDPSRFLVVSSDGPLPEGVPWELRFASHQNGLSAMIWGMNVSGRLSTATSSKRTAMGGTSRTAYGGVDHPLYAIGMAVKSGAAGMVLGWVFWRRGLAYSIVCHCAANATHLVLMPVLFRLPCAAS